MRVWTRKYPDGCRTCGTKTRGHMGQGYCSKCYRRARVSGKIVRIRREALIRHRGGERQHFCFDCESWKIEPEFRSSGNWFRTRCIACTRALKKLEYERRKEELNAARRERAARITAAIHEADRRRKRHRGDPWRNPGIVPVSLVKDWLERGLLVGDGTWGRVATMTGIDKRRIYTLRRLPDDAKVTVDQAEKIARAVDAMDEFREHTPPGLPGWSKHSDFCLRCGRYDLPHHAKGMCRRCYSLNWWYQKNGHLGAPSTDGRRWARAHAACVMCKTINYRHQGHGLCTSCYRALRRKR